MRAKRIWQNIGVAAQAQKTIRGDAAKRAASHRGVKPIMGGRCVVNVSLVDQGQPNVDIG
jgi:hypothetical protein